MSISIIARDARRSLLCGRGDGTQGCCSAHIFVWQLNAQGFADKFRHFCLSRTTKKKIDAANISQKIYRLRIIINTRKLVVRPVPFGLPTDQKKWIVSARAGPQRRDCTGFSAVASRPRRKRGSMSSGSVRMYWELRLCRKLMPSGSSSLSLSYSGPLLLPLCCDGQSRLEPHTKHGPNGTVTVPSRLGLGSMGRIDLESFGRKSDSPN